MNKWILLTLFVLALQIHLCAEDIFLKLPIVISNPNQHLFFYELITTSLELSGHNVTIEKVEIPHNRYKKYLESGKLSLVWWIESEARNNSFHYVDVDITNNLIGKRVLLIPNGDQYIYDNVTTLEEFRDLNLTGAMGLGWFDSLIWKINDLSYIEHRGFTRGIISLLSRRKRYDYFSRGIIEIQDEKDGYLDLDIEENLLLVYDRDFKFYLSSKGEYNGSQYKEIIDSSLKRVIDEGILDILINKHWAFIYDELNYDSRVVIQLKTPK